MPEHNILAEMCFYEHLYYKGFIDIQTLLSFYLSISCMWLISKCEGYTIPKYYLTIKMVVFVSYTVQSFS